MLGVPADQEAGEDEVLAVVVVSEPVDPEDVLRWCDGKIPAFAIPRFLRVVDALPKTPSEKVRKSVLRDEGRTADTYEGGRRPLRRADAHTGAERDDGGRLHAGPDPRGHPRRGAHDARRSRTSTGWSTTPTTSSLGVLRRRAKGGWLGLTVPEEYGGGGLGVTEAAIVEQEISASGAGMGGCSAVHIGIFGFEPIIHHGTEDLKQRFLPRLA